MSNGLPKLPAVKPGKNVSNIFGARFILPNEGATNRETNTIPRELKVFYVIFSSSRLTDYYLK